MIYIENVRKKEVVTYKNKAEMIRVCGLEYVYPLTEKGTIADLITRLHWVNKEDCFRRLSKVETKMNATDRDILCRSALNKY